MIILFLKNLGFWVFLVHPTVVLVVLSPLVERCFVSCMRAFFFFGLLMNTILIKLTANICLFLQLFQLFNALCVSEGGMKGAQWDTVITD